MFQPIFLVGPTCVGKSKIAIELSKLINAEIVSCDSMQVYQGMDIGTAKPTKEEQEIIPHHLISIVDLAHEYNVAQYVIDANKAIADIQKRNKIPLIVGGTGLYVKALVDGLFNGPGASADIRNKLEKEKLKLLYKELERVDPESAKKIKPQDKRRIVRALEVFYVARKPISFFQKQWRVKKDACIIGLNRKREDLYNRINDRVEKMFKDGLVSEVEQLIKKGLPQNKTASQALGYKEVLKYLDGEFTLEETRELIKKNTRHFAKRQLTWFNKDDRVKWILVGADEDADTTIERIKDIIDFK